MNSTEDLEHARQLLTTAWAGRSLEIVAETDSTNDDAKRSAAKGAVHGHTIVADHQRRGRGSHGRSWVSPAGVDLYVSVVTRLPVPLVELPPVTLAVGMAVLRVVDEITGHTRAAIKWPNDIVLAGRKCAGILVETATSNDIGQAGNATTAIVGIGLNVNRDEFPPELAARATSLRIARNASCHRGSILASVLRALEEELDAFVLGGAKPLAARVGERLGGRGQRITLDGEPAQLVGVAPSGALRVERDGQVTEHVAGTLVIDEA